jgi:hypothetical protein
MPVVYVCQNLGAASTAPSVGSIPTGQTAPLNEMPDQSLQTTFYVQGVFGTTTMATLQLQASPDAINTLDASSVWFPLADGVFTAAGFVTVNMNAAKFRAVTTSGDSGTSLTVRMM